jgi:hypothetical protein
MCHHALLKKIGKTYVIVVEKFPSLRGNAPMFSQVWWRQFLLLHDLTRCIQNFPYFFNSALAGGESQKGSLMYCTLEYKYESETIWQCGPCDRLRNWPRICNPRNRGLESIPGLHKRFKKRALVDSWSYFSALKNILICIARSLGKNDEIIFENYSYVASTDWSHTFFTACCENMILFHLPWYI